MKWMWEVGHDLL